jgi:hypothetical protein
VVAEKKWWRNVCIAIAVLVGLSRMYVGVHTPADVLVGAATSLILIWLLRKPTLEGGIREMKAVIAVMVAVSVLFLLYVSFWNFPEDMDPHNMESGVKNAYTMIGALVGFTALIPVAGAYIGAGVGAFMILTVDPFQALVFLIFLVILQQLEGNLIYPKVVGSSLGLPGIWVLAAVTVGGGIMGVGGMLLGVPLAAAAYRILRDDVNSRLAELETEN